MRVAAANNFAICSREYIRNLAANNQLFVCLFVCLLACLLAGFMQRIFHDTEKVYSCCC